MYVILTEIHQPWGNCLLCNHVLKEIIKSPQYWCCDYASTVVKCLINDLPGSDIFPNHGDAAGSVIESHCYLSGVNAEKLGMTVWPEYIELKSP